MQQQRDGGEIEEDLEDMVKAQDDAVLDLSLVKEVAKMKSHEKELLNLEKKSMLAEFNKIS